jgi:hypothetical protein
MSRLAGMNHPNGGGSISYRNLLVRSCFKIHRSAFVFAERVPRLLELFAKLRLGRRFAGLGNREVIVPIEDADKDVPAEFECSCCGELFTSTLREQLPHDQDAGFGHCPKCFPNETQTRNRPVADAV